MKLSPIAARQRVARALEELSKYDASKTPFVPHFRVKTVAERAGVSPSTASRHLEDLAWSGSGVSRRFCTWPRRGWGYRYDKPRSA